MSQHLNNIYRKLTQEKHSVVLYRIYLRKEFKRHVNKYYQNINQACDLRSRSKPKIYLAEYYLQTANEIKKKKPKSLEEANCQNSKQLRQNQEEIQDAYFK